MTPRERLQLSYELAFYPPRLNQAWRSLVDHTIADWDDQVAALDDAARLHLALSESGYASQRALERLALYQAHARAYGMPAFIRSVRRRLGRAELAESAVPGALVRDIALPVLGRRGS